MKRLAFLFSMALIAAMVFTAFGAPQTTASAGPEKVRLIVQYFPGKGPAAQAALNAAGAQFHFSFDELNAFAVSVPAAAVSSLSQNPAFALVEEDAPRYPISIMPSRSDAPALAGNQTVPYGVDMVQARDVWDANRDGAVDAGAPTGSNRTICIIDSGMYTGHEDLTGVNASGYNGNLTWNQDGSGHGTHVAGTIAAMNNALGVVGVTPGTVNLYIVRVFGNDGAWAYSSTLIDAANRCASAGANIISMSLGGSVKSRTEQRAFDSLYASGILSIAAAGNDGNNTFSYPASYSSVVSVAAIDSNMAHADFSQTNGQVELAAPGVSVLSTVPYLDSSTITVGAMTFAGSHIEFSGRGSASGTLVSGGLCDATNGAWSGKVVLCERGVVSFYDKTMNVQNSGGRAAVIYNNAPGGFLGTLGTGYSSTIVAISLSQEDGQSLLANGIGQSATVSSTYTAPASGYEYYDGTSMATPHVSAVAALVWSAKPTATNDEIRTVLQQTAIDLGAAGRDNLYGFGLVQAKAAIDALLGGGGGGGGGAITLTVTAYKSAGNKYADLSWSGASTANVDIYRNGTLITTTANDGAYTDGPLGKGGGSATYKVCEVGTSVCSGDVTVIW